MGTDWNDATDAELDDAGMVRCETCGQPVYPNGDPDWRHCADYPAT